MRPFSLFPSLEKKQSLERGALTLNRATFFGFSAGVTEAVYGLCMGDVFSIPERFVAGFAINTVAALWLETTSPLLSAFPMIYTIMELNPLLTLQKGLVSEGIKIFANEIFFPESEVEQEQTQLKMN